MAENARSIPFWMRFYAQLNTASSASTFHLLGAFSTSSPLHFGAAFHSLRYYLSCFIQVQFIFYFNQSLAFIIPALTTFLQLKYQGNDQGNSPFATHPRAMHLAVFSCVAYYLAFIVLLRFPPHRFVVIARHCLVLPGFVSVASLASILLPDFVTAFVYVAFVLLSAGELLYWLYHKLVGEENDRLFRIHRRHFRRFMNNICRGARNSSGQRLQRLPI